MGIPSLPLPKKESGLVFPGFFQGFPETQPALPFPPPSPRLPASPPAAGGAAAGPRAAPRGLGAAEGPAAGAGGGAPGRLRGFGRDVGLVFGFPPPGEGRGRPACPFTVSLVGEGSTLLKWTTGRRAYSNLSAGGPS